MTLRATLRDGKRRRRHAPTVHADADFTPALDLPIPADAPRLWSPGDPHLYDLDIELLDATGQRDRPAPAATPACAASTIDGKAVRINGKTVFQRLVLDQGYYPDGILTAPSDEALIARHRAVAWRPASTARACTRRSSRSASSTTPTAWATWCWGEFPDWGCRGYGPEDDHQQPTPPTSPSGWKRSSATTRTPASSAGARSTRPGSPSTDRITVLDDVTRGMFLATKAMDTTRPVLDTSGYSHRVPRGRRLRLATTTSRTRRRSRASHAGAGRGQALRQRRRPNRRRWSDPLPRPAVLRQRVRRHLVEPRRQARRRTPGATATRPQDHRGVLPRASRGCATSCWTTRTCSATATRSSPTSSRSRTASTASTASTKFDMAAHQGRPAKAGGDRGVASDQPMQQNRRQRILCKRGTYGV